MQQLALLAGEVAPPPSDGSILRPALLVLAFIVIVAGREALKHTEWYWGAVEWSDSQRAKHERAEWEREQARRRDRAYDRGEDFEEEEFEERETFSRERDGTLPRERPPFTWWGLVEPKRAEPAAEQGKRKGQRGHGDPDLDPAGPQARPRRDPGLDDEPLFDDDGDPAADPDSDPSRDLTSEVSNGSGSRRDGPRLPPLDAVISNLLDRGAARQTVLDQCRGLGYPESRIRSWLDILEKERGPAEELEDLDSYLVRRWHGEVMAETLGRNALRREAAAEFECSESKVKRAIIALKEAGKIPQDSPGVDGGQ